MTGGVKGTVLAVAAGVLFSPLALIGLIAMAQQSQSQTCALAPPPPPTVPAAPSASSARPSPSASQPAASPAPSGATVPAATCDAGDGLPGDGGAGIPSGFLPPTGVQQAIAVAFALAQLGKPYVFGSNGPNSWDCSSLVQAAWAKAGVHIPRITYDQAVTGAAVTGLAAMEPGDLIFIPGSDGTPARPGHVGMYIGAVAGRQYLVQAPHTGTVVQVSPVSSWVNQIAAIRRPLTR